MSACAALREGYEVYFVADALGGVSTTTHEAAVQRMREYFAARRADK